MHSPNQIWVKNIYCILMCDRKIVFTISYPTLYKNCYFSIPSYSYLWEKMDFFSKVWKFHLHRKNSFLCSGKIIEILLVLSKFKTIFGALSIVFFLLNKVVALNLFASFLYQFYRMVHIFFLFFFLFSYHSSNYCNSKFCCTFMYLKMIAKSNQNREITLERVIKKRSKENKKR